MTAVRIAFLTCLLLLAGGCANDLGLPIDAQLPFPKLGEVAAEEVAAEEETPELKTEQETQRELAKMDELGETHAVKARQEIESRR